MRKSVFGAAVVLIAIAAVVPAAVLTRPELFGSEMQINDPKNDVLLSLGSTCPGMIDLVGANFTRSNDVANITVKVGESFTSLGPGEFASWEILAVLENETDVLRTYIIRVEGDTAGFWCSFWDVEDENVETFQVTPSGQWLNLIVSLNELQSAGIIEWSIEAVYEVVSGEDVMTSAHDMAPDQGVQMTLLEP